MKKKIKLLISKGENEQIEFKEAQDSIPDSIYETVCAFLNYKGGDILLGVDDNGIITGVNPVTVGTLKQNFINTANNIQKLNPPFSLSIEEYTIDKKVILHIFVPEGSQVHRCRNKIYMRTNEGDYDITDRQNEVAALYLRKQNSYSENKIFPFVKIEDFRPDLITRARRLANNQTPGHQWQEMDDLSLFKTSSLYQRNPMTGEEGFTLAAILLLGKDELIASALPGFRIDLIKRVKNPERYDDRVDLRTNLIESYDKIMEFVAKHLPDPFYEEKGHRISLRDNIFREIIANILVHKEYSSSEPTKLVIEKNKFFTENSNKPYINGIINLSNLISHPKNPNIAKFFRQLGRVEELGSGVVKLYKYSKKYTGYNPVIKDENIFKLILPYKFMTDHVSDQEKIISDQDKTAGDQDKIVSDHESDHVSDHESDHVSDHVSDYEIDQETEKKIIKFCLTPKSRAEIMEHLGYKHRIHFKANILNPLIKKGLIKLTIPNNPRDRNQKYQSVVQKDKK